MIRELWADSVDEKPENYDFWENKPFEDWEIAIDSCLTDEERVNEEFMPMMNYRYPVPHFDEKKMSCNEIKEALKPTGLTLVKDLKTDEYYLALVGGGMDMSWDICESYINLGYLPPAHFCRHLPSMAGMRVTPSTEKVLLGCKRSLSLSNAWNEQGLAHLEEIEHEIRGRGLGYRI